MPEKHRYKLLGLLVGLAYWILDSSVHFLAYGEPRFEWVPGEFNELWMRIVIFLQFVVLGIVVDVQTRKKIASQAAYHQLSLAQEKAVLESRIADEKLQNELEKAEIYLATVHASHHIIDNLLNQLHLVRMAAEKSRDFDPDALKLFGDMTGEAAELLQKLSSIEKVSKKNIHDAVHPDSTGPA